MSEQVSERGDQHVRDVPGTPYGVMNWHGYEVVVGGAKGPYFFNEIARRRNRNRSNIIVITGAPGEGKSYFALALGQIFDPKFDVRVQVVFERYMLMRLIGNDSPLERGQVIIVDEAQYVAGARRWYEEVQKDLMENIEAVRSRGFIIIVVALHLNLLDVIIRKYVLSFMIHMETRGHGTIYRLFTPRFSSDMFRNRLGALKLPLPDVDLCSSTDPDCLVCQWKDTCMTCRAVYERLKHLFTGRKAKEAEDSALAKMEQAAAQKLKDEDLVEILREHRGQFTFTRIGSIDINSIRLILQRETNVQMSTRRVHTVRALYALLHPEETTNRPT